MWNILDNIFQAILRSIYNSECIVIEMYVLTVDCNKNVESNLVTFYKLYTNKFRV